MCRSFRISIHAIYRTVTGSINHGVPDETSSNSGRSILAGSCATRRGYNIGVGGAVISTSLAGIVTYNVTRRQTDAQVEGIKEQLKHNADESRRDRIVAARRVYLDSLRQALINWVNSWIVLQAQ